MYAEFLEYEGYQVAQASSGLEAVAFAHSLAPVLIVMDLKADPQTASIPVLVVSAHALRGTEEHAREAGADRFLTKPCSPDALSTTIAAMLVAAAEQP